jgi:hypothetical protein
MAYSGKFKPNHTNKYAGNPVSIIYRSLWERHVMKWCDDNKDVIKWSSEEVVIPYYYDVDKRAHRYFMDFKIKFKSGKVILVEVKPMKETKPPIYPGKKTKRYINEGLTYIKNQNKWKAAKSYAEDRGWTFEIWTEKKLEAMGIKPKPLKKIKDSTKKLPKIKTKKKLKSAKPFPKFVTPQR